jgi:hypothetical protein
LPTGADPGHTYLLQNSDTGSPFVRQELGIVTADSTGAFKFKDTLGATTRYFRTVYP